MSTYEKIASIIIALLLLGVVVYSYREIKEPRELKPGTSYDKSLGEHFILGPFNTITAIQSSSENEEHCEQLHPSIIAALHDIYTRLELQKKLPDIKEGVFQVNTAILATFCKKVAEITLTDNNGTLLLLRKVPFVRSIPPNGTEDDVGTEVRITATVVPAGTATSTQPTTFGSLLIPDRFLDSTSSSSN